MSSDGAQVPPEVVELLKGNLGARGVRGRGDRSLIDILALLFWERGTPQVQFFGSFRGFFIAACLVRLAVSVCRSASVYGSVPCALMTSPVSWDSCSVDSWGLMPPASWDSFIGWLCHLISHLLYQSYLLFLFSDELGVVSGTFPQAYSACLCILLITRFIFFY